MERLGFIATSVTILAFALIITFLVIDQGRDQAAALIPQNTTINESVTWTNGTFVALRNSATSIDLVCNNVYNNQTGFTTQSTTDANTTIGAGNFTCNNRGINLTNYLGGSAFNITAQVQVTYSYKFKDLAYNSTETLGSAVSTLPEFGSVIVITMVGLVLLSAFAFYQRLRR